MTENTTTQSNAEKTTGIDPSIMAACSAKGFVPARVIAEHKGLYMVQTERDPIAAELTGRFLFQALSREDLPAVGDWVAVMLYDDNTKAIIHEVLPRKSLLARKEAGKSSQGQIIAANIDIIFIVQGLDGDFNLRRLERYLVAAEGSGARPVILLSKRDLIPDTEAEEKIAAARDVSPGIEVVGYSVYDESDVDTIRHMIGPHAVVCFVGSSGAGKSTLINRLIGAAVQTTAEVREKDSRGRHTTVRRDMFFLEKGGMLIDTPGMRELGLWDDADDAASVFPEIAGLAEQCRYRDCTHTGEPGCAVLAAVENGGIDGKRYESYLKLVREMDYNAIKKSEGIRAARKKREKNFSKDIKRDLKVIYRLKGRL